LEHLCLCAINIESLFFDEEREIICLETLVFNMKQWPNNNCHKFKLINGLFYFEEQLYIVEGLACLCILEVRYDFLATRHFEFKKMLVFISWEISCLQLWKIVKEFVISYDIYSRSKNPGHWLYSFLLPFLVHSSSGFQFQWNLLLIFLYCVVLIYNLYV